MKSSNRAAGRLETRPPAALSGQRRGRCLKRTALIFLALASLLCAARAKRKSKPPDVEIVQVTARRSEGTIGIDGRVRNTGEKPIASLTLVFKVIAPENEVVTTQRGAIDTEELEPGDDCDFHWMMRDHVRGVAFRIEAVDARDRDLVVEKPGPYPID